MKNQLSGRHYLESGFWIKEDLYTKLYEYQKEGVSFLHSLYKHGKGGILADDMGLGKTIQIIAFLSGVINKKPKESILLVMPCSLMTNWADTFKAWTPNIKVKIFHSSEKKKQFWNLKEAQKQGGVLITSYGTMVSKLKELSFCNRDEFIWDIVIFDEAHTIKTRTTESCKSACSLPSKIRILITGTPVQNNLSELWTLFNVACQGAVLGTYNTFKNSYENPIMSGRVKNASPRKSTLALKSSESLMSMISPYYMRRTKEILPCLAKKNDLVVWLRPTQLQNHKYKNIIAAKVQKGQLSFPMLCKLKKVCDHPRLLFPFVVNELGEDGASLAQESSKLLFLVPLLRKLCAEGNRTLVFSHSSKMLDIIERVLTNNNFCCLRMDGTVKMSKRIRLVEAFQTQSDYSIFLLTTQVGGVGLNLTAANRVVIFDPSWTPAVDAQAIDRIYRIGQEKDVIVYRLITCGTVEEKIYCRQVFKDSLMRQATGDEKNPYRHFTPEELGNIFTLGNTRSSSTRIQLQSRSTQVTCDTKLDEHIEFLHSLDIDGISHHDLLFTMPEDDICSSEDNESILVEVENAQEVIKSESNEPQLCVDRNLLGEQRGRNQVKAKVSARKKSSWCDYSELHKDNDVSQEGSESSTNEDAVLCTSGDSTVCESFSSSDTSHWDENEVPFEAVHSSMSRLTIENSLLDSEDMHDSLELSGLGSKHNASAAITQICDVEISSEGQSSMEFSIESNSGGAHEISTPLANIQTYGDTTDSSTSMSVASSAHDSANQHVTQTKASLINLTADSELMDTSAATSTPWSGTPLFTCVINDGEDVTEWNLSQKCLTQDYSANKKKQCVSGGLCSINVKPKEDKDECETDEEDEHTHENNKNGCLDMTKVQEAIESESEQTEKRADQNISGNLHTRKRNGKHREESTMKKLSGITCNNCDTSQESLQSSNEKNSSGHSRKNVLSSYNSYLSGSSHFDTSGTNSESVPSPISKVMPKRSQMDCDPKEKQVCQSPHVTKLCEYSLSSESECDTDSSTERTTPSTHAMSAPGPEIQLITDQHCGDSTSSSTSPSDNHSAYKCDHQHVTLVSSSINLTSRSDLMDLSGLPKLCPYSQTSEDLSCSPVVPSTSWPIKEISSSTDIPGRRFHQESSLRSDSVNDSGNQQMTPTDCVTELSRHLELMDHSQTPHYMLGLDGLNNRSHVITSTPLPKAPVISNKMWESSAIDKTTSLKKCSDRNHDDNTTSASLSLNGPFFCKEKSDRKKVTFMLPYDDDDDEGSSDDTGNNNLSDIEKATGSASQEIQHNVKPNFVEQQRGRNQKSSHKRESLLKKSPDVKCRNLHNVLHVSKTAPLLRSHETSLLHSIGSSSPIGMPQFTTSEVCSKWAPSSALKIDSVCTRKQIGENLNVTKICDYTLSSGSQPDMDSLLESNLTLNNHSSAPEPVKTLISPHICLDALSSFPSDSENHSFHASGNKEEPPMDSLTCQCVPKDHSVLPKLCDYSHSPQDLSSRDSNNGVSYLVTPVSSPKKRLPLHEISDNRDISQSLLIRNVNEHPRVRNVLGDCFILNQKTKVKNAKPTLCKYPLTTVPQSTPMDSPHCNTKSIKEQKLGNQPNCEKVPPFDDIQSNSVRILKNSTLPLEDSMSTNLEDYEEPSEAQVDSAIHSILECLKEIVGLEVNNSSGERAESILDSQVERNQKDEGTDDEDSLILALLHPRPENSHGESYFYSTGKNKEHPCGTSMCSWTSRDFIRERAGSGSPKTERETSLPSKENEIRKPTEAHFGSLLVSGSQSFQVDPTRCSLGFPNNERFVQEQTLEGETGADCDVWDWTPLTEGFEYTSAINPQPLHFLSTLDLETTVSLNQVSMSSANLLGGRRSDLNMDIPETTTTVLDDFYLFLEETLPLLEFSSAEDNPKCFDQFDLMRSNEGN
ncbi:uncharacterized protein LOC120540268 [Polypterus senegalus]|nr:uncharacterized protein LOC120540268 [Polypterus senegalus]